MDWPANAPALLSERLCLSAFSAGHLTPRYVAWLNDPEVVRFSEQRHRVHTMESCRAYWSGMRQAGGLLWAIETRSGEHIGNISAQPDVPNKSVELAILIGDKPSWHQGYGTEAWGAVCEYLLGVVGARCAVAGTMAVNDGMRAIFARTGMVDEGLRKRYFIWEEQEVDMVQAVRFADARASSNNYLNEVLK